MDYNNSLGLVIYINFILLVAGSIGCDTEGTNNEKGDILQVDWKYGYSITGSGPRTPPEVTEIEDNSLILFTGQAQLIALHVNSGDFMWSSDVFPRSELKCVGLIIEESIVFGSHLNKFVSWNLRDGQERWEFNPSDNEVYSLGYYDIGPSNFWGSGRDGEVFSIDRNNGQLINEWKYEQRTTGLTYNDGALYLGRHWVPEGAEGQAKGGIVKINAATGDSIWTYQTNRGGFFTMRPILRNSRIYAGTNQGENTVFVALDAESGEEIWRNESIRVYWAEWATTNNGNRIFVNDGRNLIALDPEDGSTLWRTDMEGGHSEAGLAYLDGYVYHPHGVGMRVVDAETGEIVHIEWPEQGYFWEVGTGAGKVFVQDSGALIAYEPYSAE